MKLTLNTCFLIAFISLLVLGCQQEKPEFVYDEDQMVSLLADLHFIEAAVSLVPNNKRDSLQNLAKKQCAELYGYSTEEMEELIKKLERNIPKHREIYKRVIDTIEYWKNHSDSLSFPDQIVLKKDTLPK